MSPLTEPTRIILRKGWQPMDPDAASYIAAVEAADGQALEEPVKIAIDNFVLGCKADGIWNAIKACCIMAGARTLNGALVPLVGTAPTNFNFVADDYNRKTGLVGDGSTKYLSANRNGNDDPQNNRHISIYSSTLPSLETLPFIGQGRSATDGANFIFNTITRLSNSGSSSYSATVGFTGLSRSASTGYQRRTNSQNETVSVTSVTPLSFVYWIFADSLSPTLFGDCRLAFYSIGEALDLALLDARVTDLINKFAEVLP